MYVATTSLKLRSINAYFFIACLPRCKYLNTRELPNNLSGIVRYHRNDLLTACFDAAAGGQSPGEGGVDCDAADTQRAVTSPRVTGMSPARRGWPCGSSGSWGQGLERDPGEGGRAAGARSGRRTPRAPRSAAKPLRGTGQRRRWWRRLFWCCCFYC